MGSAVPTAGVELIGVVTHGLLGDDSLGLRLRSVLGVLLGLGVHDGLI